MKVLLLLLFSLFLLFSCQHGNRSRVANQNQEADVVDTTPKATAIFWVDKDKNVMLRNQKKRTSFRSVKAKVDITPVGKVELLSYVKPQESQVTNYLNRKLAVFVVTKIMLDSGYVKPGVQYVQLRYVPEKMYKQQ